MFRRRFAWSHDNDSRLRQPDGPFRRPEQDAGGPLYGSEPMVRRVYGSRSEGKDEALAGLTGKTWSHPAPARGRLFLRNGSEAACFDLM